MGDPRGECVLSIEFLYCGHGDTILIGSEGCWGLVDCHLTKSSGARLRIRQRLAERGIDRLQFVCLTHPHRDHFFGMGELLQERFFDRESRQVAFAEFWDSGVLSPLVLALDGRLSRGAISRGLFRLYEEFLLPLVDRDAIQLRSCQQGFCTEFGAFEIRAVGPTRNQVERFNAQSVEGILAESLRWCRQRRGELNDLSVVLVLSHKSLPFHVLLGSDATLRAWPAALKFWDARRASDYEKDVPFSAVKVSHHGASTGHYPPLYQRFCRGGATCAVVSLGPDWDVDPDQRVINDILGRGIDVYITCQPESSRSASGGLPLPGEPAAADATQSEPDEYCCCDVNVQLWPSGNVTVEPREALFVAHRHPHGLI